MPPFAICSSQACDYRLELPQEEGGISRPTPTNRPRCESPKKTKVGPFFRLPQESLTILRLSR
jgi:hypothetical protein